MPLFGVKCALCGKAGKQEDFVYDSDYYCCQEHLEKARELRMLTQKAQEKNLVLCGSCLREIKPDSYACKYCGKIRVIFKNYVIGKMCPFTVAQVGSSQYGQGNYTWQHSECIKEYCALWDFNRDKCTFLSRS